MGGRGRAGAAAAPYSVSQASGAGKEIRRGHHQAAGMRTCSMGREARRGAATVSHLHVSCRAMSTQADEEGATNAPPPLGANEWVGKPGPWADKGGGGAVSAGGLPCKYLAWQASQRKNGTP